MRKAETMLMASLLLLAAGCAESDGKANAGYGPATVTPASAPSAEPPEGDPARAAGRAAPASPLLPGMPADALFLFFRWIDYDLDAVRDGEASVPRLLVAGLPPDLRGLHPIAERKELFLGAVLPAVLEVNDTILRDRRFLTRIQARIEMGEWLDADERGRLDSIADRYGTGDFDELLLRVDVVPSALVLAQAAIESGWGTSRFARTGNALFGQRAWGGNGMRPRELDSPPFRVRAFEHLLASVEAYVHNLNTFPAYRAFRARRAAMRRGGGPLDSHTLAGTLHRYSERGADYVRELRAIIRANRLEGLDSAKLMESAQQADQA
ncbi:MAG: glucosaminidase domain-containing protein [Proteobacteria bacterium]|nr:glucosaminidase domain-containing protein [Pseudomonadota bacterium]